MTREDFRLLIDRISLAAPLRTKKTGARALDPAPKRPPGVRRPARLRVARPA